jgi:hypothetical protein
MLRVKFVCCHYHSLNMATISSSGTTKRKPRLDYDGFSYVTDRVTSEKTYWRCIKYSSDRCRSRLHTCVLTNNIVKAPTEHTCKVDGTTLQIRSFNEQIAHRAINTQETPDSIVTNSYKGIHIGYTTNQFTNMFFFCCF